MKKNVVFMLAVKVPQYPWRSEPYKYGIASWKKWCEKNDCLFVPFTAPICIFYSHVPCGFPQVQVSFTFRFTCEFIILNL